MISNGEDSADAPAAQSMITETNGKKDRRFVEIKHGHAVRLVHSYARWQGECRRSRNDAGHP